MTEGTTCLGIFHPVHTRTVRPPRQESLAEMLAQLDRRATL